MAKATPKTLPPPTSHNTRARTRGSTQPAQNATQPTQKQGKGPPAKAPPKSSAKKSATRQRSVPEQEEPIVVESDNDEVEGQESEPEPEPEPNRTPRRKKRTIQYTRGRHVLICRMTIEELQDELREDFNEVLKKARTVGNGLDVLEQAVDAAKRGAEEDEIDAQFETIDHLPKIPKVRKKRNPWSQQEERALVRAINKYGCQWSVIEQSSRSTDLADRDQTALKDKARNMMRAIIDSGKEKAWLEKYPNWAKVTIGNTRRGVHAYEGVIPDRLDSGATKALKHLEVVQGRRS